MWAVLILSIMQKWFFRHRWATWHLVLMCLSLCFVTVWIQNLRKWPKCRSLHHTHSQLLFHNHVMHCPNLDIAASYFNFVLTHCHQFFQNITRPAKMKHLQCKGYITPSHRHTSITDNEDRLLHNSTPSCSSSSMCYNSWGREYWVSVY